MTFSALHFDADNMDKPQAPSQPTPQAGQVLPSPVSADTYDVSLLESELQKFLKDLEKNESKNLENKPAQEEGGIAPLKDITKEAPVLKTGDDPKTEPQEDPDDEEDEVLFDSTILDLKTSSPQDEKGLTQIDLDNLRSLDEQLIAEFDCLA